MNHPSVHDPGHDAVVQLVHFEGDALEETQRLDLNRSDWNGGDEKDKPEFKVYNWDGIC